MYYIIILYIKITWRRLGHSEEKQLLLANQVSLKSNQTKKLSLKGYCFNTWLDASLNGNYKCLAKKLITINLSHISLCTIFRIKSFKVFDTIKKDHEDSRANLQKLLKIHLAARMCFDTNLGCWQHRIRTESMTLL